MEKKEREKRKKISEQKKLTFKFGYKQPLKKMNFEIEEEKKRRQKLKQIKQTTRKKTRTEGEK